MEVIFFPMKPTPVEVSFNLLFFKLLHEVFQIPCMPLPEISSPLSKGSMEMFWDYPVWPLTD